MCRRWTLLLVLAFALVGYPVTSFARTMAPQSRDVWRTYISTTLHLAVDYPPDWTIRLEARGGVVFSSPQGATIRLEPGAPRPSDDIIQPNTRCSTAINPHGISVHTCYATIGEAIDAYLDLTSAGGPDGATISTRSREVLGVFRTLVESARIVR